MIVRINGDVIDIEITKYIARKRDGKVRTPDLRSVFLYDDDGNECCPLCRRKYEEVNDERD